MKVKLRLSMTADNSFLPPILSRHSVDMGATTVLDCTCAVQTGQRIEWTKNGKRFE